MPAREIGKLLQMEYIRQMEYPSFTAEITCYLDCKKVVFLIYELFVRLLVFALSGD